MSLAMYVYFRGKLPARVALNRAMKELGFNVTIAPEVGSLEKQDGYMPMRLWREEAGVELSLEGRDAIDELTKGVGVDPSFDRCAMFRWGGSEREMVCAMCAAAALAQLVNGTVHDSEEGKLRTPDEAVEFAVTEMKRVQPAPNQPGTRPTDLKRYLKALLTKRSDLALVGRILFIRPLRHLIRGVIFDPGHDRFHFDAASYINPLYAPRIGFRVHLTQVWQPHFEALLHDALAEDVFGELGAKTKLVDFADRVNHDWEFPRARLTTLVLAGERDRAAEYAERTIRERQIADPDLFERHWAFLQGE